MKEVAEICSDYDEETDTDDINKTMLYDVYTKGINNCYKYDTVGGYPYCDLQNFVEILANGELTTHSAKLVDIASRINRASANAIVCKYLTAPIKSLNLTMAVTLVDKNTWNTRNYETAYDELLFQQKTGWGDWLKINPINPFKDSPEEDEEEDVEAEIEYFLQLMGKN